MARKVCDLMTAAPVSVLPSQSLTAATEAMRQQGIGTVLVVDNGQLKALVTDREMVRAVADGRNPAKTPVAEVCSPDLVTVAPDEDVDTARRRMREHAVRRVPVVEDGHVVGVLPIADIMIERDERSALPEFTG
jgi:CBS domain-containing protein